MAMKIINVNDVVGAADMNEFFVNTKYVTKPGDTSRNTTTTATIDPDLQLQVDANKQYMIEVVLIFNSNNVANFKYRFNAPSGTVLYGNITGAFVGAAGTTTAPYTPAGGTPILYNTTVSLAGQAPVSDSSVYICAVLNTAGTAGGFSVAWAQDTSSGTATILRQGSFMLVRRVS